MKCPHCKKEIELEESNNNFSDSVHNEFYNIMLYILPIAIIMSVLDNKTNIPLSVADGLAWNVYLLPALVMFPIIWIYHILYKKEKVKGRFLLFK